ncbi:hypothetical protein BDN72DRAFT_183310 [Pluteus cervinus]|uniref:Uncharacterized protein n=1 Tax=Pluteus cervinus TaxID=181527 RepID=A0ACD3B5V1_9AGAR|nr:hypothetical protein BDN72DRAFT_183310 [Pluteus cervinus]
MGSVPIPAKQVLALRASLQGARYEIIACVTLLIWDWALLLSEEVKLIHKKRWTWFKCLYICCRYYPFISFGITIHFWVLDHSPLYCEQFLVGHSMSMIPLQFFPHSVLLFRCWVFAGKKKGLLLALCTFLASMLCLQIWGTTTGPGLLDDQFTPTGQFGCFRDTLDDSTRRLTGYVMLAGVLIDIIAVIVIVRHYYKHHRDRPHGSLGLLFMQQALGCFGVIFFLTILAGAFHASGNVQLDGKGFVTVLTLPNILACRLYVFFPFGLSDIIRP